MAQAEFEYNLLGYKPEEPPSLLPYVPLCLDQPLLPGAAEDLPGGLRVGVLPHGLNSLASMDCMPDTLLNNPYSSCSQHSSVQVGGREGADVLLMCPLRAYASLQCMVHVNRV